MLFRSYELELQRMVGEGKSLNSATKDQMEKAANLAISTTELTNGNTAAAAAPRLAQGPIGSVLFMYKQYGVSMYYMMFKTARNMLNSAKPADMSAEEWKMVQGAARRQIAGIYASSALMAGVQGVPMFGIAAMLYNLLLKGEDDDDFDTAARKFLGEGIYSGAINAVSGLAVAERMGLSDLLFRDNITRASTSVAASLLEQLGGPAVGIINRWDRGIGLIKDGHIERGIEQMLPSAIGNAMKGIRFATEGARTLRGDPIVDDISPWNAFAQSFSFAPAEYMRQL